VLEVLNLPWVDAGTNRSVIWAQSLTELVGRTQNVHRLLQLEATVKIASF